MKKLLLLIFITLIINISYSQTGPGGVGKTDGSSNLVLWLDANKITSSDGSTVTNWSDQSGNNFNFIDGNGAVFNNSVINNYPAFSFNGNSNYFEKSFESTLNPNKFTVFAINKVVSSGRYKAVFSNRDDPAGAATKGFILYSKPNSNNWDFWTGTNSSWKTLGNNTSTEGVWSHQMVRYNGANNNKELYIDGSLDDSTSQGMSQNTVRPFRIGTGRNESNPDYFFKGDISEIIMFDININNAQRIIIDNYLSAKYDTTLAANNFYTQDDVANGNFDHNVAGIGQASDGSNHQDAKGTSIVRINTPSSLNNDDYLLWGEETKDATYDFTTTSDYLERINSKWRVSKRNDLGTVSVHVSESDLVGKNSCGPLKLIVDSASDFSSKTSYNMTLSGGIYTATGVNFTDGDYFSFEFIDKIVVDGTKFYNGSGTANVPNMTDGCYKLLVKNTADGSLPLTENCIVREVEVENGGKLIVNDNINFEITNGIQLDGDIRLLGTSKIVQTHTGTSLNTGSGKLYRDIQSGLTNVYQSGYLSPPVSTFDSTTYTVNSVMKDGTTVLDVSNDPLDINFVTGYDGATGSPISISNFWLNKLIDALDWYPNGTAIDENTTFNPGEGFNMKSSGTAQNFTFVGKPNDGDYAITVSAGKSSLIGNPYPSTIDADLFLTKNSSVITDDKLYFWDGKTDNSNSHVRSAYTYSYATYAGGIGTSVNGGDTPTKFIDVGQGFMVDTDAAGSIIFENSQRTFNTAPFFSRTNDFPILRIGFEFNYGDNNNTFQRQLAIGFRGLSNNYDSGYDATMAVFHPTDISLKVNNNSGEFVIIGIENYTDDSLEIPLHVRLDQQRNVTFRIDSIDNFNPNHIYLKDNNTMLYYNLESPISLDLPQGDFIDRFSIVFRNNVANINDLVNNNTISIIDKGNNIFIESNLTIKNVSIYNTLGQNILTKKTNKSKVIISNGIERNQVIFIKVALKNGQVLTRKIIKK